MTELYKRLIDEYDRLFHVQREMESFLEKAPEGYLYTEMKKGYTYYYWDRKDGKRPVYIKREDVAFAKLLGTKSYYKNLIRDVNKEIKLIEKYINLLGAREKENDYENMSKARKKLVDPLYEFAESKIERWKKEEFEAKEIKDGTVTYETHRGELVRSKSEKIIADALTHKSIPYRYECGLELEGAAGPIHPDFTVMNKNTAKVYYWEHLGRMDSSDYYDSAMNRLALYAHNGIYIGENLIISYETLRNPLSTELVGHYIEKYLM